MRENLHLKINKIEMLNFNFIYNEKPNLECTSIIWMV